MKVILTGGGTGGHFYPLIAVAEELNRIVDDENLADARLYYVSNKPYNKKILYENGIIFKQVSAGKLRLKPSFRMILDMFKMALGLFQALFTVFLIFPDVVFSKGGYAAFPTVFAAKILGIPVVLHESDSYPGRVNRWTGKFARAVAVSYKQEIDYFPRDKIVHTGQPIRHDLLEPAREGAHEFLNLEKDTPTIWVLGGSLGAQFINSSVEKALPMLLDKYQVVHQVGNKNFEQMKKLTYATLIDHNFKYRYHIFDSLNTLSMKMMAGVADVVITRAGSQLFEIAHWGIPSIVVPITHSNGNHQIKNAYNYAREGACIVIEENNLSEKLLVFEINRLFDDEEIRKKMKAGAERFSIPDAAKNIAEEIIGVVLAHEK
ncbi:MAG: UDP-N-acetylglucosamine--N-acetylmuramyl-(pentapeptide) pyrophosphoryl-undecaprenol N-acetylglucosamine transferase [Crocinitomicaceae bacterium]|jgi:UDP-N-acetylglucosamine--N-acetylmuramyl-(pentapeptide) pyrophosphoryl-undecaprenol N-acetylglucosamine transferase